MNSFYQAFCKVQAVCYLGEPNWLGWLIIGIAVVLILSIMAVILDMV